MPTILCLFSDVLPDLEYCLMRGDEFSGPLLRNCLFSDVEKVLVSLYIKPQTETKNMLGAMQSCPRAASENGVGSRICKLRCAVLSAAGTGTKTTIILIACLLCLLASVVQTMMPTAVPVIYRRFP